MEMQRALSGRPTPAETHLALCINYTLLILRRNVKCIAQVPVIQRCKMNFKAVLNTEHEKQNNQQAGTSAGLSSVRLHVVWHMVFQRTVQSALEVQVFMDAKALESYFVFGCMDADSLQGSLGI